MSSRTWKSGTDYSDSVKRSIVIQVYRIPGRRGREIAASLNLDKSSVNRFLHHEGKQIYGLIQINYAWFPPSATSPSPQSKPVAPPAPQPISVCRALADLSMTQATLKIRTLSLEIIDLAFAEDDFSFLDEQLKVELSIRRAELMANHPLEKQAIPKSSFWPMAILVAIAFAIGIAVSNKQQSPDKNLPKSTLNQ
jgi:hypothetical protein